MNTSPESSASQESDAVINPERLREIDREIASVILISSDGHILMGRKDPEKGGVYPDAWHIPGGGILDGETLEQAAVREAQEESGLLISPDELMLIPDIGTGATVKTLPTGERVWCRMRFNRFEVRLAKTAAELSLDTKPGDDLVELRWFSSEELRDVKQIPGGKEFFIKQGYIH